MKNIIIYSTKYGTVKKTVDILKNELIGESITVNIKSNKNPDINNFDKVILGGSIYAGRIQKELSNYINKNLGKILKKKVGLFICSRTSDDKKIKIQFKDVFPERINKHAISKKNFGYEIKLEKLNLLESFILKKIKGVKINESKILTKNIEKLAVEMNTI